MKSPWTTTGSSGRASGAASSVVAVAVSGGLVALVPVSADASGSSDMICASFLFRVLSYLRRNGRDNPMKRRE